MTDDDLVAAIRDAKANAPLNDVERWIVQGILDRGDEVPPCWRGRLWRRGSTRRV